MIKIILRKLFYGFSMLLENLTPHVHQKALSIGIPVLRLGLQNLHQNRAKLRKFTHQSVWIKTGSSVRNVRQNRLDRVGVIQGNLIRRLLHQELKQNEPQ